LPSLALPCPPQSSSSPCPPQPPPPPCPPLLGGYPKNSDDYPNTSESSQHVQVQRESAKRLRFPLQIAQVPKSVNPFTRALAPPFIGRRRDFNIPITPLASENIPSVNAYRIVFFI
jgi:hypothetical protein